MAPGKSVEESKAELLDLIGGLARGVNASDADKQQVDELARALERQNPNRKALASPLLSGKWELLYTTSGSILGTSRPAFLRPNGPIHQFLGGCAVQRYRFSSDVTCHSGAMVCRLDMCHIV